MHALSNRVVWLGLLLLGLPMVQAQPVVPDSFLVKPYLQFGTQKSMHILWETTSDASTQVEYGEAQLKAREVNLPDIVRLDGTRRLHEVKLDDLKVQTQYFWRVRSTFADGREIVSPVSTFRTSVKEESAFAFAFIGDTQYNSRTPWAWGVIADLVWRDRPHFVVHAGDLVDTGTRKTDWTQHFFPYGHVLMSRFPMYTVLGNHEQDAQLYYDYMVNPAPEYYYTFMYGNTQFFMIDTNKDVHEGSEQYDWLEWELAQSDATWKIVVHHHPPYSSEENDHGDTFKGASTYGTHARNLVPLYEAYGVDFCLFGHTHVYERTWPIFQHAVNQENGVIYINSGGAGGGLEDFAPTRSWFSLEMQTGHHYCTFSIFDKTLVFKAIDHEGHMFDTFQMTKEKDTDDRAELMQPPAPHLKADKLIFQEVATVKMEALFPAHEIRYTLDGSEPNKRSALYTEPLRIEATGELKARVYTQDGRASRVVGRSFTQMDPLPAIQVRQDKPGLQYAYYEGEWEYVPDFSTLEVVKEGVVRMVNEEAFSPREDRWGVVLSGYISIPETESYTFYTRSDDGSTLYLDDQLVVDNDGLHGAFFAYGDVILAKGKHKIRIEAFEQSGGQMLRAGYLDAAGEKRPLAPGQLSH